MSSAKPAAGAPPIHHPQRGEILRCCGDAAVFAVRVRFFQRQGYDATAAVSSGAIATTASWSAKAGDTGRTGITASGLARYQESEGGAKGTRTPDPLVANNRQAVHQRPCVQVTVLPRPGEAARVRICCGTSLLYIQRPGQAGLGIPGDPKCQRSTLMVHRGPEALARRRSAVSSSQPSSSASAT